MDLGKLPELLGVILPGGIGAAAFMLFQAIQTWRESRTKNEETILSRWQREVRRVTQDNRLLKQENDYLEKVSDYWRIRAASLEYALRITGNEVPEAEPLPVRPDPPNMEEAS